MQNHANKEAGKVEELPEGATRAIRRFMDLGRTGQVTLHFKEGRLMQVEERIVARV